jgi:hypothetical protein
MLPGSCLIAVGYVNCNTPLAVTLIILAVGFSGVSFGGWSVNHLDLAPAYAGKLSYWFQRYVCCSLMNTVSYLWLINSVSYLWLLFSPLV